jgi:hypothetical protein
MMRAAIKRLERTLLFATPLKRFIVPRYQYAFSPAQLALIHGLFRRSHAVPGVSIEIGCFVGATTVHLNAAYRYHEVPQRDYFALDTFSGFTEADLSFEAGKRGKDLSHINDETLFNMNSQKRFDFTMKLNGFDHVRTVKGDVAKISIKDFAPQIAFALIDVDLYLPTKASLAQVAPLMTKGGIIVVDDCTANTVFDGSLQALKEAASERGWNYTIQEGKLGIMEVPTT